MEMVYYKIIYKDGTVDPKAVEDINDFLEDKLGYEEGGFASVVKIDKDEYNTLKAEEEFNFDITEIEITNNGNFFNQGTTWSIFVSGTSFRTMRTNDLTITQGIPNANLHFTGIVTFTKS